MLATLASVIASQADDLRRLFDDQQAIQLGFLPRMQVLHTSAREVGQIYVPLVNWVVLVAVLLAVVGFGSSSALASAYGIAVTVTMFITTVLTFFVVRHAWGYPLPLALGATGAVPGGRCRARGVVRCSSSGRAAGFRWSRAAASSR